MSESRPKAARPPKAAAPQPVSLGSIVADERAQSRAGRDEAVVAEYAEAMAAGAIFPPPVVFHEAGRFWLAEGFHRVAAAMQAGFAELPCDVRQGGLRDAILHSAGANAAHGLRRTNADKRRAVLMLLQDEEWRAWADREIARRCSVGHPLVADVRATLTGRTSSEAAPRTYQDRHGNVTRMDTARIGRKAAELVPSAPAEAEPADLPPAFEAEPVLPLDAPPSNVVRAGDRFSLVPAPGAIELDALANEAAEELKTAEEYDSGRVEHRARAINGALNTFDFVRITGREYWKVYGKSPSRETYIAWVRAAKDTIDDLVKEFDRDQERKA